MCLILDAKALLFHDIMSEGQLHCLWFGEKFEVGGKEEILFQAITHYLVMTEWRIMACQCTGVCVCWYALT